MRLRYGWIIASLLMSAMVGASPAAADTDQIYQWRDENGVLRFSNRPPEDVAAEDLTAVPEIPHDAEKDRMRQSRTQEELDNFLERSRQERARREAKQQREAQRRKKEQERMEAQRQAEEAQRQAELEAKRKQKSWAKRQRVRSSEGAPGGLD